MLQLPPGSILIHPPFDNVVLGPEGMTYAILAEHPDWFLDVKDWITLDDDTQRISYHSALVPPESASEARCLFCRQLVASANWKIHVRDEHRVVLDFSQSNSTASCRYNGTLSLLFFNPRLLQQCTCPTRHRSFLHNQRSSP
ncbi:hypothetical protein FB45DRAFT_736910 [Roridomyces roridus]|uniref:Uncharacterized protein n=1 Tax=Roridomyces roridus TaxID=1738132 RepID=A0AAD7CC24_9AGAR|nr:hypothetical protein FB45DRAFT_736910 [Roridomyces roridus]